MRALVNLRIPVNIWNAIKFVIIEAFVSLIFAPVWSAYIRLKCQRIIKHHRCSATLFDSEIGRFTPASVMAYRTDAFLTLPCSAGRLQAKFYSRGILLLVNVFLLACLLLMEYGTGSTSAYNEIEANVTDIHKHRDLVQAVLKKKVPTTALTPLPLSPQDYSYVLDQRRIDLNLRVRSLQDQSRVVVLRNAAKNARQIELCGVSSTSARCNEFNVSSHVKIFRMRNFSKLSDNFEDAASYQYMSRDVLEVGHDDVLYPGPKKYKMECMISEFEVVSAKHDTYQLNYCVAKVGKYEHFVLLSPMKGEFASGLFEKYPRLKNETGVRYAMQSMCSMSVLGIESDIIHSREVALFQLSKFANGLFEYKENLAQNEVRFMDSLKERILWALLGMVSGNSEIKSVAVETNGELATLNELFVAGLVSIVLLLVLLLTIGLHPRSEKLSIPTYSDEMLYRLRDVDASGEGVALHSNRHWPVLSITQEADGPAMLRFSGAEPVF